MHRRYFLCTTAAAVASGSLPGAEPAATPRIVDTHTHFYDPTRPEGVPWPEKGSWLHRRLLPDDWAALALPHGVTHTIVVEASEWVEDNQWLLDLADTPYDVVHRLVKEFFDAKGAEISKKFFLDNSKAAYHWTTR